MSQPVSNVIKHLAIPIIVSVVSLGISIGINSIVQNPDLNVTLLERKDSTGYSNIETIIYNAGNYPANKVIIYYDSERVFDIISYNSSEFIPEKITGTDGKLRVSIDRVAPHSFSIFTVSGKEDRKTLNVWVSNDRDTFNLKLPHYSKNLGVTSTDTFRASGNWLSIFALSGVMLVVVTRYSLYQKSDSIRRNFLGVFQIKLIKFGMRRIAISWIIILIGFLVAVPVEYYSLTYIKTGYSANQNFIIDNYMNANYFIELKDPNRQTDTYYGSIVMLATMFFAIYYSISDIRIPSFIWLLRPTNTTTITLEKISSSYIKTHVVFLHSKTADWDRDDVYVITNLNLIVGLISGKELQVVDAKKDTKFENALKNKKLWIPKWDDKSNMRENFVIINESETLADLKKKMKESIKKYAIVIDSTNNVKGVVDYTDIFKID